MWILAGFENNDRALGTILGTPDPHLDGAGELALAHQLHKADKFRVSRLPEPVRGVIEAVNRIQHDWHNELRRVAGLDHEQHGARRNRRHQPLQEIHPGEGLIDHRRSIRVGACCRRSTGCRQAVYEARSKVPQGKIAAEGALKLITGNDLGDFEEDWHIRVAELHDVEEGLLLPGIADRARIVDPVVWHRSGPDAGACRYQGCQHSGGKSSGHSYSTLLAARTR